MLLLIAGHSLGGSVAVLCTLRLLRALTPSAGAPPISCICYGSPAVGNAALARHVDDAGWSQHFVSFALPGGSWEALICFLPFCV